MIKVIIEKEAVRQREKEIETDVKITASCLIRLLIGAVLGAAAGTQIPTCVKKIIAYKCSARGRAVPEGVMEDRKLRLAALAADAVLTALAAAYMRPAAAVVAFLIIQIALVCIPVDWYIRIIANEAVLILLVLGILYRILAGGAASLLGSLGALALVTAIFGGSAAVMTALKGSPEVGAGDLKYAMVLAITVGWPGVIYLLAFFAAAVLIYIFLGMKMSALTMKSYFPMCLHLSVGLLGALFVPVFCVI